MDNELFDQLSDIVSCFDLCCDKGVDTVSSLCDSLRVCPQNQLLPLLSYMGLLEDTGFRFDVIVQSFCFCS